MLGTKCMRFIWFLYDLDLGIWKWRQTSRQWNFRIESLNSKDVSLQAGIRCMFIYDHLCLCLFLPYWSLLCLCIHISKSWFFPTKSHLWCIKHNAARRFALAAKAPSFKGHGNQHETFPTTRNHSWCFFQRCESVVNTRSFCIFFWEETIPDITKTLKPNGPRAKAQRMAQPKKAKKSLSWVYLIISLVTAVGLAKSCCMLHCSLFSL